MPLQVTVNHGLPYLVVEVSGPAQLADLRGIVALAAATCATAPYRRCLFDFRETQTELAFTEQLQLGTFVGDSLRNLERVASVVTPALRKGTSEKAAQKLGTRLRAFTDVEDAKAWIIG